MDSSTVTRHDDRGRYELDVDDEVLAFAEFSASGDTITIPYIETALQHRGKGYSSMLMDGVNASEPAIPRSVTTSVPRASVIVTGEPLRGGVQEF